MADATATGPTGTVSRAKSASTAKSRRRVGPKARRVPSLQPSQLIARRLEVFFRRVRSMKPRHAIRSGEIVVANEEGVGAGERAADQRIAQLTSEFLERRKARPEVVVAAPPRRRIVGADELDRRRIGRVVLDHHDAGRD